VAVATVEDPLCDKKQDIVSITLRPYHTNEAVPRVGVLDVIPCYPTPQRIWEDANHEQGETAMRPVDIGSS
jgi:hypothetical protein